MLAAHGKNSTINTRDLSASTFVGLFMTLMPYFLKLAQVIRHTNLIGRVRIELSLSSLF